MSSSHLCHAHPAVVANRPLGDGFMMPQNVSYKKMLGLEGPGPYESRCSPTFSC